MRNTDNNKKVVYRWWSGWQTDKLEAWIEKMEAEGWRLEWMSRNAIRRLWHCKDQFNNRVASEDSKSISN